MFKSSSKKVTQIIHLEVGFYLENIEGFLESKSKRLYDANLLKNTSWDSDNVLIYEFDILPHPNGEDSIFFHVNSNRFSNTLEVFDYFRDWTGRKAQKLEPSIKKLLSGLEFLLLPGAIACKLLTKDDKEIVVFVAPTNELSLLQRGGRLSSDWRPDHSMPAQLFEFEYSNQTFQLARTELGFFRGGVAYRNSLCRLKAYTDPRKINYNNF